MTEVDMHARYYRAIALRAVLSRQIGPATLKSELAISEINNAVDTFAALTGDTAPTDEEIKKLTSRIEKILDEHDVPYEYLGV